MMTTLATRVEHDTAASVAIQIIATSDLAQVAQVHMLAFPDSSITALGAEAARRYYEWQLTGPHDCVALGAYRGDVLLGFCFFGVFRGALSGFLRKNRNYLILRVLTHPWLAVNPLFRDHILQSVRILLRHSKKPDSPALPKVDKASFGILSIAVDPQQWGHKVGKSLMQAAEQIGLERGFSEMSLTVNPKNTRAVLFYEGLGWTKTLRNGVWQGLMSKPLVAPVSVKD
jgi:ribosomal protein S18 acetylase RimI-like enzyme